MEIKSSQSHKSRRDFIRTTSAATVGFTLLPSKVISGFGHRAPSDKLNIAGIGVGGKGHANLLGMNTENIVALCDIDWNYSKSCFADFPAAKKCSFSEEPND